MHIERAPTNMIAGCAAEKKRTEERQNEREGRAKEWIARRLLHRDPRRKGPSEGDDHARTDGRRVREGALTKQLQGSLLLPSEIMIASTITYSVCTLYSIVCPNSLAVAFTSHGCPLGLIPKPYARTPRRILHVHAQRSGFLSFNQRHRAPSLSASRTAAWRRQRRQRRGGDAKKLVRSILTSWDFEKVGWGANGAAASESGLIS